MTTIQQKVSYNALVSRYRSNVPPLRSNSVVEDNLTSSERFAYLASERTYGHIKICSSNQQRSSGHWLNHVCVCVHTVFF